MQHWRKEIAKRRSPFKQNGPGKKYSKKELKKLGFSKGYITLITDKYGGDAGRFLIENPGQGSLPPVSVKHIVGEEGYQVWDGAKSAAAYERLKSGSARREEERKAADQAAIAEGRAQYEASQRPPQERYVYDPNDLPSYLRPDDPQEMDDLAAKATASEKRQRLESEAEWRRQKEEHEASKSRYNDKYNTGGGGEVRTEYDNMGYATRYTTNAHGHTVKEELGQIGKPGQARIERSSKGVGGTSTTVDWKSGLNKGRRTTTYRDRDGIHLETRKGDSPYNRLPKWRQEIILRRSMK